MKQITRFFTLSVFSLTLVSDASALSMSSLPSVSEVRDNLTTLSSLTGITLDVNKLAVQESENFCAGFTETKKKLEASIEERDERVKDYLGGIVENLGDRRGVRDAKREEVRSLADQRRSDQYEPLKERATNDEEKKVVQKYQEHVEQAVEERREAIDTAVGEYRKSIDSFVAKRQKAMESVRADFQSTMKKGLLTVEKECEEENVKPARLANDLKATLSIARTTLVQDKKNAAMMGASVKSLVETRKKAVSVALTQFQLELKSAKAELQAAFAS